MKVLRTFVVFVAGATVGAIVAFLMRPNMAREGPAKAVMERGPNTFTALIVSRDPKVPVWSLDQEPGEEFYRFNEPSEGVLFDLDADGWRERVAWPASGVQLAFIVRDINRNGLVDNGKEFDVVGPRTLAAVMEIGDPSLPPEPSVMLWRDEKRNGFSEPNELQQGIDPKSMRFGGPVEGRWFGRRGFVDILNGERRAVFEVVVRRNRAGVPRP